MTCKAVLVLSIGVLFPACYASSSREADGFWDPAADALTEGPDSSDLLADPIWDLGNESDAWDVDTFEFDGYSPPTCRLFAVDVDWDVFVEEPYVSSPFFEASDEPMLSVISLYEASSGPDLIPYPVTVHVSRTYRPVVLLLSSCESVEWVIQRAEGARIDRILVAFNDASYSTVSGADDVPTDLNTDLNYGEPLGICWPRCDGEETENEVRAIAAELGLDLGSFHGAGSTDDLTLWHICREDCLEEIACAGRECGMNECGYECGACPADHLCVGYTCMACSSDCSGRECGHDGCDGSCGQCPEDFICADGGCIDAPYYTACEDVARESHYCLTISGLSTALLGLDSGLVCQLGKGSDVFSMYNTIYAQSIALLDGHLLVCVDNVIDHLGVHGILRYSMLDGRWEVIPVLCYGLARYQDGLVVQPDYSFGSLELAYYSSIEDLRSGNSESLPIRNMSPIMAVQDHTLYTGGEISQVNTYQLPSGSEIGTINLESYGLGCNGMAVTDDGLLVSNASDEGRVTIFDAVTGAHLGDVVPVTESGEPAETTGLVCFTNP